MKDYIAYFRLSKKKHKGAQYGIGVQKNDVARFIEHNSGCLIASYEEIETGTDRKHRPVLEEALQHCQQTGACLLIAKLDRLTRSVHFLSSLQKAGVDFTACDFPDASPLMLHIMVAFAEHEASTIRSRIKKGLEEAKKRGVVLGAPRHTLPAAREKSKKSIAEQTLEYRVKLIENVEEIRRHTRKKLTYQELADRLNRVDFKSPRGGKIHPSLIQRAMKEQILIQQL
jgi:DNA invertase Pin-like site-specific DNA recombinase